MSEKISKFCVAMFFKGEFMGVEHFESLEKAQSFQDGVTIGMSHDGAESVGVYVLPRDEQEMLEFENPDQVVRALRSAPQCAYSNAGICPTCRVELADEACKCGRIVTLDEYDILDVSRLDIPHLERLADLVRIRIHALTPEPTQVLREPMTSDYCLKCGESPDSATHWAYGHEYVPPTGVSKL